MVLHSGGSILRRIPVSVRLERTKKGVGSIYDNKYNVNSFVDLYESVLKTGVVTTTDFSRRLVN